MSDYLYLVAELAVAFAGFTAIVSVLDRRFGAGSATINVVRLRQMLEVSLVVIAASLMPGLLSWLGLREPLVWRVACTFLVVGGAAFYLNQTARGLSAEARAIPGFNLMYARFLQLLGIGALVASGLGAFGWIPAAGGFHLAVTLLLALAGLQFLRAAESIMEARAKHTVE